MRTIYLITAIAFLCLPFNSFSQTQSASDKAAVEATINLFLDGWATGDTVKVGKSLHASNQLKSFANGKFNNIPRAQYLKGFKPHPREATTTTEILTVDIVANIASAKTRITTEKLIFIDFLHLIRTSEGWFIVDKVASRADR